MLSLDDPRWTDLKGGYRIPFDPRPLLVKLENTQNIEAVWHELWDELHHQGDVGEASFAAVPHLVRIYRNLSVIDYNAYALVAIIELARAHGENPDVPEWLRVGYFKAIQYLAKAGATEVLRTDNPDTVRAVLSVLAIAKGLRTHGRFLIEYSDRELDAIDPQTQSRILP
jgi:hypothetical protein